MKKILFAAMAALAITSCSQNEEIEAPAQKAEISFKTVVGKASRATPMITDNFLTFKVYGYNVGTSDFAASGTLGTAIVENGSLYSRANKGAAWGGDTYYWPAVTTEKLCFFAFSPNLSGSDSYTATTGYPIITYTIKNVDSQEDLVAAKALNLDYSTGDNKNGINLSFLHTLTQINFSATFTAGFTYKINSITISDVSNKGNYNYENGKWSDHTIDGNNNSYIYNATYESTGYIATDMDKTENFSTGSNALMLLPQDFTAASTAKITIDYETTVTSTGQKSFKGTKSVELKNSTWEEGKNIRYNLILPSGAQAVTLKVDVDTWKDESSEREENAQ